MGIPDNTTRAKADRHILEVLGNDIRRESLQVSPWRWRQTRAAFKGTLTPAGLQFSNALVCTSLLKQFVVLILLRNTDGCF